MTDVETMLRDLIAIPSVNPAFVPEADPRAGEGRVADYLETLARRAGLETHRQPVAPGRINLLIHLRASSRKPRHRLLLAPHLDTVGGPGMSDALFQPTVKHGRLYGRGACDTKGSVAAMVAAMVAVSSARRRPSRTDIMFVGLADEENHQAGSRTFVKEHRRFDLAIVGEPTLLKVVTAHKGDLWLRLETKGKAAHGARPELGRNAVHEMARIVVALETEYAQMLSRRRHSLLGRATINVGTIRGGHQPNIVPDHCQIQVDRRTLPGENDAEVKRELMIFLRARGFQTRLYDTKGVPSRPMDTPRDQPMVKRLLDLAGQRKPEGVHFFSDGGVLSAAGIPTVLFGPGSIDQAHTVREWIPLSQLHQAARFLRRFLETLP